MSGLRIGSLFSGADGLTLGAIAALESLGYEHDLVFVCDVEEYDKNGTLIGNAPAILAHNYPDVPNLGDITKVDWSKAPQVDVLVGGFPCTDVSLAGRQAGLKEGTRSGLWSYFYQAIQALQPEIVVIENVPGLYSAPAAPIEMEPCPLCVGDQSTVDMRALGAVLADLAEGGLDAEWGSLRASDVGAAHRRERVFILAWPTNPTGNQRRLQHGNNEHATANSRCLCRTAGRLAASRQEEGVRTPSSSFGCSRAPVNPLLRSPAAAEAGGGPRDRNRPGATMRLSDQLREEIDDGNIRLFPTARATDGTKSGPNQRGSRGDMTLPSSVVLLPTPKSSDGEMGLPRTSGRPPQKSTHLATRIAFTDWGTYEPAIRRWELVLGRPAPKPTIISPTYLKMIARRKAGLDPRPVGMRGSLKPVVTLSPRFVEWHMGQPEGRVADVPDLTHAQQLRALGNGVVPLQAQTAVSALLARAFQEKEAAA